MLIEREREGEEEEGRGGWKEKEGEGDKRGEERGRWGKAGLGGRVRERINILVWTTVVTGVGRSVLCMRFSRISGLSTLDSRSTPSSFPFP
jgi:hypothetical protein